MGEGARCVSEQREEGHGAAVGQMIWVALASLDIRDGRASPFQGFQQRPAFSVLTRIDWVKWHRWPQGD